MDIEAVVSQAVTALREAGARAAYVHGSRAEGADPPGSDLDIAVLFGSASPPATWDIVGLPAGVDLLVLDDAPLELRGRVASSGRLILDEDPPTRVAWEATTRKIWADEAPRRDAARRDFAEARRGGS